MLRKRTKLWVPVCLLVAIIGCCCARLCWGQRVASAKTVSPLATVKVQLDRGDLVSAEAGLWSVLTAQPDNEQALTLLGIVRGRQQRYAEAEALFRRVLQLNPRSVVASRNLANALLAEDKPEDARRQYHKTIDLSPQDVDLKIEVTKMELSSGNFAEALAVLEAIRPERFPPSAVPLKAASLLGLGRRADAEKLMPLTKASPAASLELARVFIEAKIPEPALRILQALPPASKSTAAQIYYLKGKALRQVGDNTGSLGSYRQALAADPKSLEALLALAELYAIDKKHAESLAMLEKARAIRPNSREILGHFIVEAMQTGRNEKALQAAQDLQRISSDLDDRYLVASVMLQQKQYVGATRILEDYVTQRPQEAKAFLGLGIGYLSQLRYADARQALERSLQLDPKLAEAEYQMGMLTSQQGSRQEAIQHWQKAVELQAGHSLALFSLGTVYLESGELAQAESAFSRSLAADPRNMKAEYNLALVLTKLGKQGEAKVHFDRYRQMQEQEHTSSGNPKAGAGVPQSN